MRHFRTRLLIAAVIVFGLIAAWWLSSPQVGQRSALTATYRPGDKVKSKADAIAVVLGDIRRNGGDPATVECSATRHKKTWFVTAWDIWYPNEVGSSRFVPGGCTYYEISLNGTILSAVGGK